MESGMIIYSDDNYTCEYILTDTGLTFSDYNLVALLLKPLAADLDDFSPIALCFAIRK